MTESGNNGGGEKQASATEELLLPALVSILRERPLPEPSPEATRRVFATAREKIRDVHRSPSTEAAPDAECEILPVAPTAPPKRRLWQSPAWMRGFVAAAAALLVVGGVWQVLSSGPTDNIVSDPGDGPKVINVDELDPELAWNAPDELLTNSWRRLDRARPVSYGRSASIGDQIDHRLIRAREQVFELRKATMQGLEIRRPSNDFKMQNTI